MKKLLSIRFLSAILSLIMCFASVSQVLAADIAGNRGGIDSDLTTESDEPESESDLAVESEESESAVEGEDMKDSDTQNGELENIEEMPPDEDIDYQVVEDVSKILPSMRSRASVNTITWDMQLPTAHPETGDIINFLVADYNGDGIDDLYLIRTMESSTGMIEVHIMDGANSFSTYLAHIPLSIGVSRIFSFELGDYNRDGKPDLYCIKTNETDSGKTEVHILNGANKFSSFLLHAITPLDYSNTENFFFKVADANNDGVLDVYIIKTSDTGTNTTEVHVINGAANYGAYMSHAGTALHVNLGTFDYCVDDYNNDGKPDIYAIKKTGTSSNKTELHVLNGSNNYSTFLTQLVTPLGTDYNCEFIARKGEYIYTIIKSGTSTGKTELHRMKLPTNSQTLSQKALAEATKYVGVTPYVWGGNSLVTGTDCSGFVNLIYAKFGVTTPRQSTLFRTFGNAVAISDMQPGDIVCYDGHVGFYAGNGLLLSALGTKYGVTYNNVNYATILAVRRITG